MNAVYFGFSFQEKAPEIFGHMCLSPSGEWVTLRDIAQAIEDGETVTVRPASASELKRAEEYVALIEVGKQLGEKIGSLLDQFDCDPKEATGAVTEIRDAVESSLLDKYMIPTDLLDKK